MSQKKKKSPINSRSPWTLVQRVVRSIFPMVSVIHVSRTLIWLEYWVCLIFNYSYHVPPSHHNNIHRSIQYVWNMGRPMLRTDAHVIVSIALSMPTLWSIKVDHKIGEPPLPPFHRSQIWHSSEWTKLLDWMCTRLDGETLWVGNQVVRMMIRASVSYTRSWEWGSFDAPGPIPRWAPQGLVLSKGGPWIYFYDLYT